MTICMVCQGTGMVQLSNFPTSTGGRMNDRYIMSGIECGACHGSGRISDGSAAPPPREPTAGEQLIEHADTLLRILRDSRLAPDAYRFRWVNAIHRLQRLSSAEEGLRLIDRTLAEFDRVADTNRPTWNVFDVAVSRTMQYEFEMQNTRHEIEWIKRILEHVLRYQRRPHRS